MTRNVQYRGNERRHHVQLDARLRRLHETHRFSHQIIPPPTVPSHYRRILQVQIFRSEGARLSSVVRAKLLYRLASARAGRNVPREDAAQKPDPRWAGGDWRSELGRKQGDRAVRRGGCVCLAEPDAGRA